VFGPRPRSYDYAFPRQARRNALRSVLSEKVRQGRLLVVDSLTVGSHRTRDLRQILEQDLSLSGKTLLVYDGDNRNLRLAARNNPLVTAVRSPAVSVVDVLNHNTVLASEAALVQLREVLTK
jgi:large subunit ribosomal protein L4